MQTLPVAEDKSTVRTSSDRILALKRHYVSALCARGFAVAHN